MNVVIKVINKSKNALPEYKFPGDSGMDIRADIRVPTILPAGERCIIPTGLFFEIPEGYEFQVRPRSGLAAKYGITVLNTPGTIDAGFHGELQVILYNSGKSDLCINPGDRIAQLVLQKVPKVQWDLVEDFGEDVDTEETENNRGTGALGHSGIK